MLRLKWSCCVCHRQLGANGCRAMLAVPVSFVSEHIETLEEMDMEYRELVRLSKADRCIALSISIRPFKHGGALSGAGRQMGPCGGASMFTCRSVLGMLGHPTVHLFCERGIVPEAGADGTVMMH